MKFLTKILTGVFFIVTNSAAPAAAAHYIYGHVAADTIIVDDSTRMPPFAVDPLKAFRSLFVITNEIQGSQAVQLNPMAVAFVQDYVEKHTRQLESMKDWGRPYFELIDNILTTHGLPGELKYLAVIESDLKSNALSLAGAVGPWQFMPATARNLGLKVSSKMDERTDYHKSTVAAAQYLSDLYSLYGDWLLVIAAYNCGAGTVDHAIRKSGSHDFWKLQYFLPEESRNHVKKFIATHFIMEGEGGITTVTKQESLDLALTSNKSSLTDEELKTSTVQSISGRYSSLIIAKNIEMDVNEFNRFNADFDRRVSMNATYTLRLPSEKMDTFNLKKNQILDESMRLLLTPIGSPAR